MLFDAAFMVPHDHPALAVYHPGRLDAPEAVVLEELMGLLARKAKLRTINIVSARFKAPFGSGVPCQATAEDLGGFKVGVTGRVGGTVILEAVFVCEPLADAPGGGHAG